MGAVGLGLQERTTSTNTISEILENLDRHLPVDASIRDADTAEKSLSSLGGNLLVTLVDVGLDHDTDDTSLTLTQLIRDLLGDKGLVEVVLVGVTVGAIDHNDLTLLLSAESLAGSLDASAVIVGSLAATAEDDETVLVTGGLGDGGQTLLGDTEETVGVGGGADGVNGDGEVAVCAVLVSDGEGETGGQLAVELGLGGAGANGTQRNQIGQVLWGDGIEHLGGDGETGVGEVGVQLTGDAETLVDVVGLVDVGIVDQTLPADGGAGLLEVGAHDDADFLLELGGDLLQTAGVLERGVRVVDGAGAHDDEQAVIALLDDLHGLVTASADGLNGASGLLKSSCQLVQFFILKRAVFCAEGGVASCGWWEGKKSDSPRGSHSARSRETAKGRIQGLEVQLAGDIQKTNDSQLQGLASDRYIPRVSSLTSVVLTRGIVKTKG